MKPIPAIEDKRIIDLTQSARSKTDASAGEEVSKKICLQDCLLQFQQEEILKGDEQWFCSKCKSHQTASKRIQVYRPPKFLIIHLKRFKH